jgi:hypothetical protein
LARRGEAAPGLEPPPFPEDLRYLWDWYRQLRIGLGEAMTWSAVDAWARRMEIPLRADECEALFLVEGAWLAGRQGK